MTDIATRYMRLVERRPELTCGWEPRMNGGDGWTDGYGVVSSEVGHALIFAKLVGELPEATYLTRVLGNWYVVDPKKCRKGEAVTPLEAIIDFWEGRT